MLLSLAKRERENCGSTVPGTEILQILHFWATDVGKRDFFDCFCERHGFVYGRREANVYVLKGVDERSCTNKRTQERTQESTQERRQESTQELLLQQSP